MLDVEQKAAATGVEPPGGRDAADVESEETAERDLGAAGERDRGAEALRDEEGAVGGDRRSEADDRSRLFVRLTDAFGGRQAGLEARDLFAHDRGDHLE